MPLPAEEPENIRYLTEDYPPSNYIEDGKLKGIAVDILKLMWAEMGVQEQRIQVLPWARGYEMIQKEPACMLFAMTRSAERENLFKWVGPIYRGYYALHSSAANPIHIDSLEEAKKYRIGVIRADFSELDLLAKGFPDTNLYRADSVQQLTQMLYLGRVDLLYLYSETIKAFAPLLNANQRNFRESFIVSENRMYYALSKSTDDALIDRFQKALDAIDKDRREIVTRYNCTP